MRQVVIGLILLALTTPACGSKETPSSPTDPIAKTSLPDPSQATAEVLETSSPTTPPTQPPALATITSPSPLTTEEAGPTASSTAPVQAGIPDGPLMIGGLQAIQLIGDPQSGDSFFALTPAGLHITRDGAVTWIQVTPAPLFDEFVFSPAEPGILYAGAGADCFRDDPAQTLYKSINGGATWNELPSGVNLRPAAVNPADPNEIWAVGCTGPAHSTDGGDTWTISSDDLFSLYNTSHIVPSPDNWSLIFVAGISEGGSGVIASSQNGGGSWTALLQESPERPFWWVTDLLVLPTAPLQIYSIDPHGLWRSHNGGSSWDFFDTGLEDVVYRDGADFSTTGLNALVVDTATTPRTIFLGTAQGIFGSSDEGETWEKYRGAVWEDMPIRDLALLQVSSGTDALRLAPRLLITTDQGVYVFGP